MNEECHPRQLRFLLIFYRRFFDQHRPLSVAVRISLRHILTQVWLESVSMVPNYNVLNSRWSSYFWVKMCVFHTKCQQKQKSVTMQLLEPGHLEENWLITTLILQMGAAGTLKQNGMSWLQNKHYSKELRTCSVCSVQAVAVLQRLYRCPKFKNSRLYWC